MPEAGSGCGVTRPRRSLQGAWLKGRDKVPAGPPRPRRHARSPDGGWRPSGGQPVSRSWERTSRRPTLEPDGRASSRSRCDLGRGRCQERRRPALAGLLWARSRRASRFPTGPVPGRALADRVGVYRPPGSGMMRSASSGLWSQEHVSTQAQNCFWRDPGVRNHAGRRWQAAEREILAGDGDACVCLLINRRGGQGFARVSGSGWHWRQK